MGNGQWAVTVRRNTSPRLRYALQFGGADGLSELIGPDDGAAEVLDNAPGGDVGQLGGFEEGVPNTVHCPPALEVAFSDQGEATYEALKHQTNLFLMLCGHAGASEVQPRRADTHEGHTIHTLLSNYQRGEPCPLRCGNGWLRIMTFSPANDLITGQTCSDT